MNEVSGRLRFDHAPVASHDQRRADGKAARAFIPRSAHATYLAWNDRDPLGIIATQNESRLPELVPLRLERMLANPFAFYRGSAALQVADLAGTTNTEAGVVICGDAHIANFGLFASPQRTMVFDLNDFDEATFGPWEWDVKRLVTSVVIAAQHKKFSPKQTRTAALRAAAAYRTGLREMLQLSAVDRYYFRAEVQTGNSRFGPATQKIIDATIAASKKRTSAHVLNKITERADDGTVAIIEQPPTLTHVEPEIEERVAELLAVYRSTASPDIAFLLSQYTATDIVRRVVGVGSVGTRCFILVLTGPTGEALVLQVKQASRSVVDEFGGINWAPVELSPSDSAGAFDDIGDREGSTEDHGRRVVTSQRILQAVSDPFLGYFRANGRGFYVRQFRDRNQSFDIDALERGPFNDYVDACGRLLARAHAQSPNAAFIDGYVGRSTVFDEAIVEWSHAYARQSFEDFEALRDAVDAGKFPLPTAG
ncbi:DUF2252 domain-containing protein [Glaciibacter psychrotolerans]|uniref:Uncharacterized protein (DUF2252 family) n=1 Tax=Glaciibacter psychrotolerans TaxID=670054 RepID=A0A7Z0J4V4_9MICO|nr:DUF2252 domain-containing protein [Leifsonia psychrotolerans]NYJ18471.1 uncharacterized protein (DUF2252 family) [Leifsonia psychrotolerans]